MLFSDDLLCVEIELFAAAPTTRPPTQSPIAPSVPDIGPLPAIILVSDDKLFFYPTVSLDLPRRNGHWTVLI